MFSPYYAWARAHGKGDPLNHCAVNVALYSRDRKRWAMTERGRGHVGRASSSLAIGPSLLTWDGDALTIRIDEVTAPAPTRIRGVVRVYPKALTTRAFALDPAGPSSLVADRPFHPRECDARATGAAMER